VTGSVVQVNISGGGVPKHAIAAGTVTRLGVEGDAHAHPQIHGGPLQAVLLITAEGIAELAALGFPIEAGSLGENITTSGIDRRAFRSGQRWRIGADVVLEITKRRAPCATLNAYGPKIQRAVFDPLMQDGDPASPRWGLSGMYASVVKAGVIRPGDPIELCK